jgi:hypothetical protein
MIANLNRRQDDDKSQPRFTGNEIMEVGEEWSLDTIGPLPADESESCNTHIMVAIDGFSRFVVLEPASDASGESVARFLLKLVGWFGRPKGIRTDGGSQYDIVTTIISSMCSQAVIMIYWALIDMLLWPIRVGHRPMAKLSGLTRKSVDIFGSFAWIGGSRMFKWSCMLPLVQRSINTQLHEVLGVDSEPARIVFGGFQTMNRFLLPDTIPGAVQQGIAAIPAKDRRLVVGEYVKHLV